MTDLALGLDLGGTNIRAAIVAPDGTILTRRRIDTPTLPGGHLGLPDDLVSALVDCAAPLLAETGVLGAGLGSGGQFDPAGGVLRGINTGHPAFVDYPLAARLGERLGLPVWVDNDVKMAALGELCAGAGQGCRHLICVAVGTGIGGALILDGRLVHGHSGLAGHLGQTPDFTSGTFIEAIAGGMSIGQRAIAAGILPPQKKTSALFELARAGDSAAQTFIRDAGRQLGRVVAGLIHTFEPEAVLLGGTVGVQPEMVAAVNDSLAGTLMLNWRHITARPMALGPEAAQIGAAMRVFIEKGVR